MGFDAFSLPNGGVRLLGLYKFFLPTP
eukprot:SAG11_NODE_24668_length_369_cov_49.807407_1_plen_26_part_10